MASAIPGIISARLDSPPVPWSRPPARENSKAQDGGCEKTESADDSRARHLIETAQQGANRGRALTQRMLAFARRQELTVSSVEIPELIAGMAELLTRSLDSKVELELRFPLRLAAVLADANQLELALLNLVVNARDAMPQGGSIICQCECCRAADS
jgi:signal transduction histidine kinase